MQEDLVRSKAFAMPLTSPAYPVGPYRFSHREYLIITYRTDPDKLRELVPEPLQVGDPLVSVRLWLKSRFRSRRTSSAFQRRRLSGR
jgi:acetoacetate decarboxylase